MNINYMKFIKKYWQPSILVLVIIIAIILRFSNIFKLQFFTYDQSRDALFVKRIIVDREFRLLGTQTSLPGMYLPPYYFYTIAPVLWIFGLNPVGIDFYSALIGVLTVPLVYYVANKLFGKPAGIFSAGLFAVSPIVVELTRRAWNPNTLPFFILVSFFFVYQYFKEKKDRYFLLAFGFYGYSLSLHFGAWTLAPLFIILWLICLVKEKKVKTAIGALLLIFFFISPLLLFELRHNFFLTSQAKVFFFDGNHIGMGINNIFESFMASLVAIFVILISGKITLGYGAPLEFGRKLKELFSFSQPISVVAQKPFSLSFQWWGLAIFFIILISSIYFFDKIFRKEKFKNSLSLPLILIWIWIIWGVFVSLLYSGKFFFFYYLYLFPAPILLFGLIGKIAWEKKSLRIISLGVLFLIIFFHLRYTTVFSQGWRDISDLRAVSKIVSENIGKQELFNLATIQKDLDRWDRNSVDYRYFVETFGKRRALDWYPEDYERANILFVIDETGKTDPIGSNIMEIQKFSPNKIIGRWETGKNIVIYKIDKKGK